MAYPPPRGVPWKCIAAMTHKDKCFPRCHYNHPKDSPRLKFLQEVGCLALVKHGYLCWKDVTASSKVVDPFETKFPKIPNQSCTIKSVEKRVSNNQASKHVFSRRIHSPSISKPPLNSSVPPSLIENNILLLTNQSVPISNSYEYADIYFSD